jgi:hypothetical protein
MPQELNNYRTMGNRSTMAKSTGMSAAVATIPRPVVKIAAKLPDIGIEVDVVEDQYGIGR